MTVFLASSLLMLKLRLTDDPGSMWVIFGPSLSWPGKASTSALQDLQRGSLERHGVLKCVDVRCALCFLVCVVVIWCCCVLPAVCVELNYNKLLLVYLELRCVARFPYRAVTVMLSYAVFRFVPLEMLRVSSCPC